MASSVKTNNQNDFSQGSIVKNILRLALPMTLAQLINVLYNIVDRIYIGRIPQNATMALTGLGLCLPIISMVIAFANLFGMGGAPLCSIQRGKGNDQEAEAIMGNSFIMITIPYADSYITIYLLGSVFVMIGLGMNSFINSQGFGKTGMLTVLLGAVANIVLDPVFIFLLDLGVQGAAWATILSQGLSALWIVRFLTSEKAILKLRKKAFRLKKWRILSIVGLGLSGFTMSITNSLVQIMYNASLARFGGDVYVGVMTVVNSVREVISLPISGLTNSAQPVMGYNYGAGQYKRVKQAILFMSVVSISYTTVMWGLVHGFPEFFIRIFNHEGDLVAAGVPAMQIYYFGFFMMSLQFAGQSVFVALGKSKNAVFFSIFRKVIIVVPLILILPNLFRLGVNGIFMAEPVSNFAGGIACFFTMLATVWPELGRKEKGDCL